MEEDVLVGEESQDRKPRDLESRNNTAREQQWSPPPILPDPTPQPGWVFRYIRTSMTGQSDATNVSQRFREGWEPCKIEDHPELEIIPDHDSRFPGCVEIGGLLLCKAPNEVAEARQRYYENVAAQQMQSVDNSYMKENDPRMPLLKPDRKTRVTFGRGS
jgi:hypothetical protein|tara:strand:- start:39 stop:518 length:480 start_codon:yes stop_codon:yes gene_type:complete